MFIENTSKYVLKVIFSEESTQPVLIRITPLLDGLFDETNDDDTSN